MAGALWEEPHCHPQASQDNPYLCPSEERGRRAGKVLLGVEPGRGGAREPTQVSDCKPGAASQATSQLCPQPFFTLINSLRTHFREVDTVLLLLEVRKQAWGGRATKSRGRPAAPPPGGLLVTMRLRTPAAPSPALAAYTGPPGLTYGDSVAPWLLQAKRLLPATALPPSPQCGPLPS